MAGVMEEARRLALVRGEQPRTHDEQELLLRETKLAAGQLASDLSKDAAARSREAAIHDRAMSPECLQGSQTARLHFRKATSSSSMLDKHHMRSDRHGDSQLTFEMNRNFQGVAHLTEELDGLFAEMGRQTAVIRAGHRSRLRLIPNVMRTVEVRLPRRASEDAEELTVQLESRCDPHYHSNEDEGLRRGLVLEEKFDLSIAESQGQIHAGSFKVQSLEKITHRLRLTTDGSVLYICLFSKKECHIECACKVWQGGTQSVGVERGKMASVLEDDEDEDKHLTCASASVGMRLQAKLKVRQQDLKDQKNDIRHAQTQMITPLQSPLSSNISPLAYFKSPRGRQFNDFIWDGHAAPHTEEETVEASKRLMHWWVGHCSKYSDNVPKAKGQWVHKLSAECPRKMVKFLKKAVQDRSALTSIAVVGAFAFFLKRQSELHLMRTRTAMRQLVWYKAFFAASRIRYLVCIVGKNRELEKRHAWERKQKARKTIVPAKYAESESDSDSPVEEVRKYCEKMKKKASPRSLHGTEHSQSAALTRAITGNGKGQTIGRQPTTMSVSARTHRHLPGVDDEGKCRRALHEERYLEFKLASQGFILRPNLGYDNHSMGGRGPRAHQMQLAPGERQRNVVNDISQNIGRPLQFHTPPPVVLDKDGETSDDEELEKRAKALYDVNEKVQIISVKSDDISKIRSSLRGRTEAIGSSSFGQVYQQKRAKAAAAMLRREEAKQNRVVATTHDVKVKFTKRYLLQFFEHEQSDLPWLPLMQSLMLVIHGVAYFNANHEQHVFQEKLRNFNQIRKAALKKPGLFPPIEAALWSHPVILHLAQKLQRAMCRGDGALAWKSSLFDGCYEESSGRDAKGHIIHTSMRLGDEDSHHLRKLAEVSGQFYVGTSNGPPNPLAAELTPFAVTNASTTTSSGHVVRTFGDRDNSCAAHQTIFRPYNHYIVLPTETKPRDLRIETLRRKRRERDALVGPRDNHPLSAHSDLTAQRRYGKWMMRTDVPNSAYESKLEMLPFFEGLVSPSAETFSPPRATCKRLHTQDTQSMFQQTSLSEDDALTHATLAVEEADELRRQMQELGTFRGKGNAPNSARHTQGGSQSCEADAGMKRRSAAPQTAEDVGKLFLRMDALQTILAVDSSEIGGFAQRCPAGWKSGYRVEPMSKDEIRKAHIVQKFCAGAPTTTR